jgi:regulatory protein
MPKIMQIEFRRRKPQRFIVHFDDDRVHTFSPETALKYGFSLEKDFEDEVFIKILEEDSIRRAKDQALSYLEIRSHSKKELFLKLMKKGYQKKTIDSTLEQLEDVGLIDDNKFAVQYIESELMLRPCGKNLIKSKLYQKGLREENVEPLLKEFYQKYDERSIALKTAQKFYNTHKYLPDSSKKKEKLTRHLFSRGFDWEIIDYVFQKIKTVDDLGG